MKLRVLLCIGLLAGLTSATLYKLGEGIQTVYHLALVANSPYEYMFSPNSETVTLGDHELGVYGGGMKGLLMYSGIKYRMAEAAMKEQGTEVPTGFYDLHAFEAYSGIAPFTDGKTTLEAGYQNDFLHYNPEFIAWGFDNMIPKPKEKLGEITYQQLYDVVGHRFLKVLVESHAVLEGRGKAAEAADYQAGMDTGTFDVYDWLGARYDELQPINARYDTQWASFEAEQAYSWWVRRTLDGTEPALWEGLMKVLKKYDKAYYKEWR